MYDRQKSFANHSGVLIEIKGRVTVKLVVNIIFSHQLVFVPQSKDGKEHHGRSAKPKSDGVLLHVHGGGFVAQSSKSHEVRHKLIQFSSWNVITQVHINHFT